MPDTSKFLSALTRYVKAEIDSRVEEQDEDSMGAYYEEEELRKELDALFSGQKKPQTEAPLF